MRSLALGSLAMLTSVLTGQGCNSRKDLAERTAAPSAIFRVEGSARGCPERCWSTATPAIYAGLGLDPTRSDPIDFANPTDALRDLQQQASSAGQVLTRLAGGQLVDGLRTRPRDLFVALGDANHVFLVRGVVEHLGKRYAQIIHGDSAIHLVDLDEIQAGDYEVAWAIAEGRSRPAQIQVGGNRVVLNEMAHDFGIIDRNAKLECEFRVENQGPATIAMREVSTSCSCTVVRTPKTQEIAPGQFVTIPTVIDPADTPSITQRVSFSLVDQATSQAVSVTIHLYGNRDTGARPVPPGLDFGRVAVGESRTLLLTMTERPGERFELVRVHANGLPIQARTEVQHDHHGFANYKIRCRLDVPPPGSRTVEGNLTLQLRGNRSTEVPVPVRFEVASSIVITPANLALGEMVLGKAAATQVSITGDSATSMDVSLDDLPAGVTVRLVDQTPSRKMLEIEARPGRVGIWSGAISGTVNLGGVVERFSIPFVGVAGGGAG